MFKETQLEERSKQFDLPVHKVQTHRLIQGFDQDRISGRRLQPEHTFKVFEAGGSRLDVYEDIPDIKNRYGKDWPVRKPVMTLSVEMDFVLIFPWFGGTFPIKADSLPEIIGLAMNYFKVYVKEPSDMSFPWGDVLEIEGQSS